VLRFLVTGALTVVLTGAGFAIGAAAETTLPANATGAVVETDAVAVEPSQARAAAVDPAAPTAGADLAMWGVTGAAETPVHSGPAALNGSRLVRRFADGILHRSATLAVNLTRDAMRFLGVPYAFGGTSSYGFDCSGYVQHVFAMLGVQIPRTADGQYYAGKRVRGSMVPGDLVFFETYTSGPSHVGIYLGGDRFVHASSSHGVTVSNLHERYWSAHYLGAKRLI
jgi:cell wall-associated NlpC family hydrolase